MVSIDPENGTLNVPDIGVTLRTLMAAAASGYKTRPKRVWKVIYKGIVVGSVRIKSDFIKQEKLNEKEVQVPCLLTTPFTQ